jgi:hypothetical protein
LAAKTFPEAGFNLKYRASFREGELRNSFGIKLECKPRFDKKPKQALDSIFIVGGVR